MSLLEEGIGTTLFRPVTTGQTRLVLHPFCSSRHRASGFCLPVTGSPKPRLPRLPSRRSYPHDCLRSIVCRWQTVAIFAAAIPSVGVPPSADALRAKSGQSGFALRARRICSARSGMLLRPIFPSLYVPFGSLAAPCSFRSRPP